MRCIWIKEWKIYLLFLLFFLFYIIFPASVRSQLLKLSGLISVDYSATNTTNKAIHEKTRSKVSDLTQRYSINGSGIIVDPRLASYAASLGITRSTYKTQPVTGATTKVTSNTITYSLQMNALPSRFPLTLFAQRNIITVENAPDLITDTYSLGWYKTLRTYSTLRATLLQIGTKYDDPTNPKTTKIRIANLSLTQQLSSGSVTANYQYTDYHTTGEKPGKVSSYSIRGESQIRPSVFFSGNITYFPKGSFFAPGITTTSETTGELNIVQRLPRFTQSGNYTFRKTPGGEIKRDIVNYNMSYRPFGKNDYRAEALYSDTGTEQTDTIEYRIAGGITHRPFYGLSISTDLIVHHFDVSGRTSVLSGSRLDRIGILSGVNYVRPINMLTFTSTYALDYSVTFADRKEAEGSIVTHTATLGLQTRTLQATQILGTYSLLVRNNTIVPADNRQEQVLRVEADTYYFNRWHINGSVNYSNVLDYGDTFIFDSRAEYFIFRGTSVAWGYKFANYPSILNTQDSELYFVEAQHNRSITRRLTLSITAHDEKEHLRYLNRNRAIVTSILNYRVGRLFINFEFREDYTKYPDSSYNIQSYYLRASRTF